METGRVFDIQRFCVHDGPGIRVSVFLQGCPLRCVWCHNPEGLEARALIGFDADKCAYCGACESACARGAHRVIRGAAHDFARENCARCGNCARACLYGALEAAGRVTSVSEVMRAVERDAPFFANGEGGLTLTGGEPTMQPGFARALARAAKRAGINVCVETCGYCARDDIMALAEYTDMFLFDIKELDDERHARFTGVGNALIISNLRALDAARKPITLRCPLIPGFNACDTHISAVGELADSLKSLARVELEPYHPLGIGKRARFGMAADARLPAHIMPADRARELLGALRAHTRAEVTLN